MADSSVGGPHVAGASLAPGNGWTRTFGVLFVLTAGHVARFPASADPLPPVSSASSSSASSSNVASAWSYRPSSSISDQIMMRQVMEQIRSLKFGYEESMSQLIRKLDTLDMKIARHGCDVGLDTLMRKVEILDTKVNRLDSSNSHRFEELSKNLHTKGIRQELALDGLIQKVDENHERIKQKLIFAEKRMDTMNSKMQVNENSFTRLESRLTDIDTEISEVSNTLDDIKTLATFMDDKHNNTQRTIKDEIQVMKSESVSRQQVEKLFSTVMEIREKLNDTCPMVRDDASVRVSSDSDRTLMDLKTQISQENMKIEDKISNMYNNLWNRFMSLETTAKHLLKIGNITRRQLREDFQSLLQSEARFVEPESHENYMDLVLDVLKRMLLEHKEQMDTNLQMTLTSQNLFIDSLNKSLHQSNRNEGLKEMELTLSSILEKIIYTITNKTSRMDSRMVEVMQMIKDYKTQVMRSLGHLTKMVIALTEDNKEAKKRFENGMLEMTEMNEFLASGLQDLYEKFEIMTNMTPNCEEINKNFVPISTSNSQTTTPGIQSNATSDTNKLNDTVSIENLEKGKVQGKRIEFENDDVVKIYAENGRDSEPTNARYQILNSTDLNKNSKNGKKQISIVIPYEAIDDGRVLKSRLDDFLSQLPVSKAEAIIFSTKHIPENSDKNQLHTSDLDAASNNNNETEPEPNQISYSGDVLKDEESLKNEENSEEKENTSIDTSNFEDHGDIKNISSSNENLSQGPVTSDTKIGTLNDTDDNNDDDVFPKLLQEFESLKFPLEEIKEDRVYNGDTIGRFHDLDGKEEVDKFTGEEGKMEKKISKHFNKFDDSKNRTVFSSSENARSEGPINSTDSIENLHTNSENKTHIPSDGVFLTKNITENITASEIREKNTQITSNISSKEQNLESNESKSSRTYQGQAHNQSNTNFTTIKIYESTSTVQPTTTNTALFQKIDVSTNRSDKTSTRRGREDLKKLFNGMKIKRLQRIQELENIGQENDMYLRKTDDVINDKPLKDYIPAKDRSATKMSPTDTSKLFTSSEEVVNNEPQFDSLYEDLELPYSA